MAVELAKGGQPDRRYCEQCEKHVVNLSAFKKQRAEAELAAARAAGKRLCVRVIRDQETGRVLTREDLPRITARLAKHRPPQIAAALALALLQWSCSDEETNPTKAESTKPPVLEGHSPVIPEQYLERDLEPLVGEIMVGDAVDGADAENVIERPLTAEDLYLLQQLGGYVE